MRPGELYPYQVRWLSDRSRRRVWCKSRRVGGTWAVTLDHSAEACGIALPYGQEAAYEPTAGVDQYIISTGEDRAREALAECLRHVRSFEAAIGETLIDSHAMDVIRLKNGRKIMALPSGNVSALHGWGGSVILDEAAHLTNGEEVARVAWPVADRTATYRRGCRISVVSTPQGLLRPGGG